MSLPYLMVTAARAGIDPNVVKLLGTSWINEQMRLGKMDRATGERFLSGAGDPTPLTSATQITTEGMRNATTLALPGATADAAIRQNDATIMMVVPRGKNVAEPHTVGEIKAHPELYENYDAARAAAGDVPKAVSSEPGNPAAPSVYTPTRDATGQTAPNTTIQETDATSITVVTPDHRLISSTVGALKAHPEMGRRATDADLTYANASPTLGAPPVRAPQATLGTSRPLPQSTDALAAENAARTGAAVEGGAPATAETIAAGTRAGLETQQTRTTLTPDQELRISGMVDQTVQQMYPVPGGFHWSNTSALAALSATKKAEVISRVRDLAQTAKYRTDPAAAVPAVLQQMQAEGKLPKAADRGLGWFSHTAPYLTGGKDPRFIVDEAPALAGTVTQAMPGGGGAQPAPAQTAPAQAVPTVSGPPPPGALGPAPPGAVEGQTGTGPGGVKGVVKGGWMMPLTAAAAPTTAPAQAAPAASPAGPSLADTVVRAITAPARAVKSRMRPRAPKGALSADQVPPS
jgi:hypothetical protein